MILVRVGEQTQEIYTILESNIAMENGPFEDVFPIQDGDFPLLC